MSGREDRGYLSLEMLPISLQLEGKIICAAVHPVDQLLFEIPEASTLDTPFQPKSENAPKAFLVKPERTSPKPLTQSLPTN